MTENNLISISDLPDDQYDECMATGRAITALMNTTEPQYAMCGVVGAICNYMKNTYSSDRHERIIEGLAQSCISTLKIWVDEDAKREVE
jgi:hypothetical protein